MPGRSQDRSKGTSKRKMARRWAGFDDSIHIINADRDVVFLAPTQSRFKILFSMALSG